VEVKGGLTEAIAGAIAKSIVGSSLVKTAVFGADANWGRILCAAGYAGAPFDPKLVDVWIGDVQVAHKGMGLAFDEEAATAALKCDPVQITVDLHMGDHDAKAYGCDLTYDYVRINASYRS
ncbi:MAG: bifunctional ornithine acetyltransferase/N-acetylglutamate synthase, partial [Tumebacillaceae bacterium]